jgi:2-iminobutanoate/2-iminopropanoate deaminase
MRAFLLCSVLACAAASAADLKPVFPAQGAKPIGPYSPGISAGGYLYVAGQGARDAAGNLPAGIEAQTKQCLENVKAILAADKLSLDHVVWSQVFLKDVKDHAAVNKVYASYFPKDAPARSVVAVNRMPGDTPVEIAVVAVRNRDQKKVVNVGTSRDPASAAVVSKDRVYVSGVLGLDSSSKVPSDPKAQVNALVSQIQAVLKKAGMEMRDMAYAHVYVDSKMPMKVLGNLLTQILPSETALSVIETTALPYGAHVEISGIASKKAIREGDCTSIEDTVYCAGVGGTIDQALKRVKDNMTVVKLTPSRIVASNVYIDDLKNFEAMNKIYGGFFADWHPARVTVQPTAKADELNLAPATDTPSPNPGNPRAQVTVIAVR